MKMNGLTFREALEEIKQGSTLSRKGVEKQVFLAFASNNDPIDIDLESAYIATKTPTGNAPWIATFEDMESDDWYVLETDII